MIHFHLFHLKYKMEIYYIIKLQLYLIDLNFKVSSSKSKVFFLDQSKFIN
jgi:hypothetical protein